MEEEQAQTRGDPAQEERIWLEKLAEADRRRERYIDLAADGLMKEDELRAKLATLQGARETAHRELASIDERRERLLALELDKENLLESYAGMVPEALVELDPEERHHIYKLLRLEVRAHPDKTLEVSGVLGDPELGTLEPLQTY
jgi:hypothetical protein